MIRQEIKTVAIRDIIYSKVVTSSVLKLWKKNSKPISFVGLGPYPYINITLHIKFNILGIHVRFSTYINAIFFTSSEYFGPMSLKIRFCFHNY